MIAGAGGGRGGGGALIACIIHVFFSALTAALIILEYIQSSLDSLKCINLQGRVRMRGGIDPCHV